MVTETDTNTDNANAEIDAASAPKYRKKGTGVDKNADAPDNSVAKQHGLELDTEVRTESGFVDPSVVQIVYHTFDGRVVPIPAYMVPKTLAQRLPFNDLVPDEFKGKPAWSTRPNNNYKPGTVKCLLHKDQTEEVKAMLNSVGISRAKCSKSGIMCEFHLNEHMRLKHKQELKMIDGFKARMEKGEAESLQRAQLDAILKLAEAVSKK